MTTVYGMDCRRWQTPEAMRAALPYLDAARRRRVSRLRVAQKRAQCVGAGVLLTHLLGDNGTPPHLIYGAAGKPCLADRPDVQFNLSHTGDWVFCAVSDGAVGLDAETVHPIGERVIRRCFSAEEQAWLRQAPADAVIRLWTRKEAYGKLTGAGLAAITAPVPVAALPAAYDAATAAYWCAYDWQDIRIAVCAQTPGFAETVVMIQTP